MRRLWYWLLGWRAGDRPPRAGEYFVQYPDSAVKVGEFVRGVHQLGGGWSVMGPVAYWKPARGPIKALPVRVSYRGAEKKGVA